MNTYASDTSVSVGKTRAELEDLLTKYGATRFGSIIEERSAIIAFELGGRHIRFNLPLPARGSEDFQVKKYYRLGKLVRVADTSPEEAQRLWEQACRSKWRALFLSIKAKLVACQEGITTFEEEFLAHFVIPGGKTIGERFIPQLEEIQRSGKIPPLTLMQ